MNGWLDPRGQGVPEEVSDVPAPYLNSSRARPVRGARR
jgi:hypothetical protein